jgi:hypothetical protein
MRRRVYVLALAVAILSLPGGAQAAAPSASTGGTQNITQTSALLKGTINPNGEATTYYFQYGTTKAYGSQTPTQGPTAATKGNMPVSAALDGLAPATTYHYRLVAVNASGAKVGGDKTFKTLKPAPTVSLSALPARLVYGAGTTLAGQFTPSPGSPVAGIKITLQQDQSFPFSDFKAAATVKTDAAGHFSFRQIPLTSTSYRVESATNPKATSAAVVVPVAFKVTLSLSTSHPRRGKTVVFSGTVGPQRNGALVRIQKLVHGHWRTVKTGVLAPSPGAAISAYRVRVRVRTRGYYRAYVGGDALNTAGASRRRLIRPR